MLDFGISGLLYKNNVLLYDRETESLWSQLKREAIAGPLTGHSLITYPSLLTSWKRWRKLHPDTLVLSRDTGYFRDYDTDPYASYHKSPFSLFATKGAEDGRLAEKELVLGVTINGETRAYPFSALERAELPLADTLGGEAVTIHFDKSSGEAYATLSDSSRAEGVVSYWFAFASFNPGVDIYKEQDDLTSGNEGP